MVLVTMLWIHMLIGLKEEDGWTMTCSGQHNMTDSSLNTTQTTHPCCSQLDIDRDSSGYCTALHYTKMKPFRETQVHRLVFISFLQASANVEAEWPHIAKLTGIQLLNYTAWCQSHYVRCQTNDFFIPSPTYQHYYATQFNFKSTYID